MRELRMSRIVLASGAAESDSRSREFDLHGLYAGGRAVCGQLSKNGKWTYSRGLLGGLQARFGVEHSNHRNSPSFESKRRGKPHVAALLPWSAGKQFSVFRAAANPRDISEDIHKSFHDS